MSATYAEFLQTKVAAAPVRGMAETPALAGHLFADQAACVEFGLRVGSWGCFTDTGMGKTAVELEWAKHAADATNGKALILTPLAVARQIEAEGRRWGYDVRVIREQGEARAGINVSNYDRLEKLDSDAFGAIALDESAILKNFTGATSRALVSSFAGHRFRMSASATPAPNDHTELAQHSAFLGLMDRSEMLVRWFINDSGDTKSWRLKGHAVTAFFDWMGTWARMAEHPRDLGFDRPGFDLPALNVHRHRAVEPESPIMGGLFGAESVSATELHDLKRATIGARADLAAELVSRESGEPWVVWCDTDYEADALSDRLPDAAEVRGSYSTEQKEEALAAFADGLARVLITKPSICGWGLNWQHAARMAFVGRGFSYESWYQAVRRCWRYGQTRPVDVHLIVAEGEDAIGRVIDRKSDDHARLRSEMKAAMLRAIGRESARRVTYNPKHSGRLPGWLMEAS